MKLSPRQSELLKLLLSGHCDKRAAQAMNIAARTLNYHRDVLYKKLCVNGRNDLMARYMTPTPEAEQLMRNN